MRGLTQGQYNNKYQSQDLDTTLRLQTFYLITQRFSLMVFIRVFLIDLSLSFTLHRLKNDLTEVQDTVLKVCCAGFAVRGGISTYFLHIENF